MDSTDLYAEAEAAIQRGDRRRALELYAKMLVADRSDPVAREGLRRMGIPIDEPETGPQSEPESEPAPATIPGDSIDSEEDSEAGPKSIPTWARPIYKAARQPEVWMPWVFLLAALLLVVASLLAARRETSINVYCPTATQGQSDLTAAPENVPSDLLANGTSETNQCETVWQIDLPYPLSPAYSAVVAETVLSAQPGVKEAVVGSVTAKRSQGAIVLDGVNPAALSEERRRVLASAIWRYAELTGKLPASLDDLTPDIIDRIPVEPMSGSSAMSDQLTGDGGWLYEAPAIDTPHLWEAVYDSVKPNLVVIASPSGGDKPAFEPITIKVSKADQTMEVWSGSMLLRQYSVGGLNDYTPVGTFRIDGRSVLTENLPDGSPNPFGTRWLRLSVEGEEGSFGIHGADTPQNVGTPLSLGCIRLSHGDLEDLYELAVTGTPVTIADN